MACLLPWSNISQYCRQAQLRNLPSPTQCKCLVLRHGWLALTLSLVLSSSSAPLCPGSLLTWENFSAAWSAGNCHIVTPSPVPLCTKYLLVSRVLNVEGRNSAVGQFIVFFNPEGSFQSGKKHFSDLQIIIVEIIEMIPWNLSYYMKYDLCTRGRFVLTLPILQVKTQLWRPFVPQLQELSDQTEAWWYPQQSLSVFNDWYFPNWTTYVWCSICTSHSQI